MRYCFSNLNTVPTSSRRKTRKGKSGRRASIRSNSIVRTEPSKNFSLGHLKFLHGGFIVAQKFAAENNLHTSHLLMPQRAAAICKHPGCGVVTRSKDRRCPLHPRAPGAWGSAEARVVLGRHLQQARRELFASQPLCAECSKAGRISASTERDHIVPLAQGGRDVPENTQGLCAACHAVKSEQERLAGFVAPTASRVVVAVVPSPEYFLA